jgi:hypothetical protein
MAAGPAVSELQERSDLPPNMNALQTNFSKTGSKWFFHTMNACKMILVLALSASLSSSRADTSQTFATPEEAVAALVSAANAPDTLALHDLFGAAASEMENPDRVQGANEHSAFAGALNQATRIVRESDSRCVLEVGDNRWPFPIPIVESEGRWRFDSQAGKVELLNRRIGKNEVATLRVLRACVEAQREYASEDRDGSGVHKFAQKMISTPGTKDGLYWSPELDSELSPLGPLLAKAHSLGQKHQPEDALTSEPFHGYFFKILTRQGKDALGGKYSYIINGNMIGGFAFVAWPAFYGDSGIMTFIVNQQGRVYQKDLGPKTATSAESMKEFDPDNTWTLSAD